MKIKLIAGTDIGLRGNNEDNFTVSADLAGSEWNIPVDADAVYESGSLGSLLVVADGMGGQNAGEVASAIAVQVVHDCFVPDRLRSVLPRSASRVGAFLKEVVREIDRGVKSWSEAHPETRGMGSTLVLAWMVDGRAYVAWVGDSRAYSYVPGKGIARLTKDHSYVQQLVDRKEISEEEAMSHPDSNIITRSLGDPSLEARADFVAKDLRPGEVILLCSDGLCGVCPDGQLADIIESAEDDLALCKDKLIASALSAGGTDNITIALARVESLPEKSASRLSRYLSVSNALLAFVAVFLLGGLLFAASHSFFRCGGREGTMQVADSVQSRPDTVREDLTPESPPVSDSIQSQEDISASVGEIVIGKVANTWGENTDNPGNQPKDDSVVLMTPARENGGVSATEADQ